MQKILTGAYALVLGLFLLNPAAATTPTLSPLATSLQGLLAEANALKTQVTGITLTPNTLCGDLLHANQAARTHINNVASLDASLAAPLTLDADVLAALQDLSAVYIGLGSEAMGLSMDLNTLAATADQLTIAQGIAEILRLSDDIGTMSDRIGEMADKILVMSDNIGLMADRIVLTQEIQNNNIRLTQQNILAAQTNVLNAVSQIDTSKYNTTLSSLLTSATSLELNMNSVILTAWNVSSTLSNIANDVGTLKTQIVASDDAVSLDAANSTMTINQTSLTSLVDLSGKMVALATAVKGYAVAVNGLNAVSATPSLADSGKSILTLSSDIGVMADRILEEADLILEMSDNIGLQADQIILTQQLQSINLATTQTALLDAQKIIINLFLKYNL
jgi:hypothetical protein